MSEIDELRAENERLRKLLADVEGKLLLVTEFDYTSDDLFALDQKQIARAEDEQRTREIKEHNAARPIFGRPETGKLRGENHATEDHQA